MRILQIIPSLASGGAERIVVELCNEQAQQGEEVYLCTVQDPNIADYGFFKKELNKLVHFVSLNQSKGFQLGNVFRLFKIIRTIKPQIVHLHLSTLLYGYFLPLIFPSIRFVYTIHNLAHKTCNSGILKLLNKIFFKYKLIHVITISDECKQSYSDFYTLDNAILLYNGRSLDGKSESFHEVETQLKGLKTSSGDMLFVHIARYHQQKNQSLLIDVFNRLDNEGKEFQLLILGDWSFCNEAKQLKKRACDRIHFLGTKNNVQDYLYCADAFCLTSIYEGLPISLLEALSCGCVPICTPVGGIKDVIQDGVTGYLSDGISVDAYYKSVIRFLESTDKIDKQVLKDYFESKFSIEKTASEHIDFYKGLLSLK